MYDVRAGVSYLACEQMVLCSHFFNSLLSIHWMERTHTIIKFRGFLLFGVRHERRRARDTAPYNT